MATMRTCSWRVHALRALAFPLAVSGLYTGGGLTILSENNLDSAPTNGSSAILVSQKSTYGEASRSCALLGETLWDPDAASFAAALNASLSYQVYQGRAASDTLYWIARSSSSSNGTCRAISPRGSVRSDVVCASELPALCTQSAPLSNSSTADSSERWRVALPVAGYRMTGYRDAHAFKFRGVRYAERPARFAYARVRKGAEEAPGAEVLAVEAGADCVQPVGEVKSGSSEDCLFMNIWTSSLPEPGENGTAAAAGSSKLKPVMLYLYGGGFTSGSGKNTNTDGTNLASRGDVVAVSVNYRVGNAGFLAFADGIHRGNYGLSDMVAALEWVRDNVAFFGGDPARVTLFGESAGAQATRMMLGSPRARGLFHRAIMMSDPVGWPSGGKFRYARYPTPEQAYEDQTVKVLEAAGCKGAEDEIGCLAKIDGFDLVNLDPNVNTAVEDGVYLDSPETVVNQTNHPPPAGIAVMTGTNRDESAIDMPDFPAANDTLGSYLRDHVLGRLGMSNANISACSPAIRPFLPPGVKQGDKLTPAQIYNVSVALVTEGVFACLDNAKAYSAARHRAFGGDVYSYVFNRTYSPRGYTTAYCDPPKTAARPDGDPDLEYFKCHAGEQMVVFGTERRAGAPDRDGLDGPFMRLVGEYWTAFARTGDPNPDPEYLRARGRGRFIGRDLEGPLNMDGVKMGLLQVAAKMQELLIIASLTTVILHVLRAQLASGDGVPLGWLASDKAFTQIRSIFDSSSYFWSPDFWGGLLAYRGHRWKRNLPVIVLLGVGGIIAALAGPASAILMIPRVMEWPAGGMVYWLNGSEAQIWPTRLDAHYLEGYNCSSDYSRIHNYKCPSSGFTALRAHLWTWWQFPERPYQVTLQDETMRKVFYVVADQQLDKDTWVYTTHGPSANMLDASVHFYKVALRMLRDQSQTGRPAYPRSLDLAKVKSFEVDMKLPVVRTSCVRHWNVSIEYAATNMTFPVLEQFSLYRRTRANKTVAVTANVQQAFKERGLGVVNGSIFSLKPREFNLFVIPIDIDAGDASSLGLILLAGSNGTDMSPVTCTVDARWGRGQSIIDARLEGDELQSHEFTSNRLRNVVKAQLANDNNIDQASPSWHPRNDGAWDHISLHPNWYDLLSPSVSDASLAEDSAARGHSSSPNEVTLLERLLSRTPYPTVDKNNEFDAGVRLTSMEITISMFLADGLSRVGWQLQRDTQNLFPPWVKKWTEMPEHLAWKIVRIGPPVESFSLPEVLQDHDSMRTEMHAVFTGYVMALKTWFDYIAVVLLLLHALIALLHTIWGLWKSRASEAWDSILELLVLSQQSAPVRSGELDNTCAGIASLKTMGLIATVEAVEPSMAAGEGREELQLAFNPKWQKRTVDSVEGKTHGVRCYEFGR
ncbi:uncharacterized protein E0L32_005998 [Thyridium curvatum]|uniref:Carboxylesterase type B domain-containing protein n=1 Tax=Thyridium curvatum TaxID=1093900 RepID=A0A507B1D0_9PEZI|nr:uncharacterized protein E0L32_005998 [Thyridium curvatum]TPX13527.1 hypothetical protein E0L32_005998 [Thyridium curvatum]